MNACKETDNKTREIVYMTSVIKNTPRIPFVVHFFKRSGVPYK
jgi:hypothetical protein